MKILAGLVDVAGMSDEVHRAMERLARRAEELGFNPPERGRAEGELEPVLSALERMSVELALPNEVFEFWAEWYTDEFDLFPRHVGLYQTDRAANCYSEIYQDSMPNILFPICGHDNMDFAVELSVPGNAGGRIFNIGWHGQNISLISERLSDFLNLLAEIVEQSPLSEVADGRPWDSQIYGDLMSAAFQRCGSSRLNEFKKPRWPQHWLTANGFPPASLATTTPTHRVAQLIVARTEPIELVATLHGRWKTRWGGGPLRGDIGTFTDESGSMDIYRPFVAPDAGRGPNGACEIEVVAGLHVNRNLDEQLRADETSVIITAMRPILEPLN